MPKRWKKAKGVLSVRTEILKCAVLTYLRKLLGELMSKRDRIRHKLGSLVRCITEHHSLITCTCIKIILKLAISCFERLINTHGNISRLLIYSSENSTGISIKTVLGTVIADLLNSISYHLLYIHIGIGGYLTCYNYEACAGHRLAGYTAHGVLFHACIKDSIRYSITNLIGMSFRHGL
jgi:hypothetical protein